MLRPIFLTWSLPFVCVFLAVWFGVLWGAIDKDIRSPAARILWALGVAWVVIFLCLLAHDSWLEAVRKFPI